MKKNTIFLATFLMSLPVFGQVGINTPNPHLSASLELASNNKALYLNRVANTSVINDPQSGMVIYDLTDKCVKAYQGNPAGWSGCIIGNSGLTGAVTSINCAGAYFTPNFATVGQPYTGTLTVPYTGGNGGIYPAQTTTVNGLTFNLPLGVFATGDGNVVYNVTGTPATAGTTAVNITIGGQSCSGANAISLVVNPATGNPGGVLPGTVTLAQNSRYWVASVYDNDYLPYTAPTAPASTATINANGSPDTLVDVQGSITTTGITVYIPATVTGSGGTVAAWSNTITIPANFTQDGISRQVQLSWAAQTLTTSNTSVTATLKAIGGTLNAKKLDINAGIGNDYLGLLLGTFQYPYNQAGALTTYQLRDIPGIPDRMFGQIDNADKYEHNFLYLPIQAEDGKIWLNNNLGANYANLNHPAFNLTQQATSTTDVNAMGSLLQWGRKADGHELMERNISAPSYGTFKSGVVYGQVATWTPTYPYRIFSAPSHVPSEWTSATVPPAGNRWLASSPNNPCPQGFKVPVKAEWEAEITASGSGGLYSTTKKLKLTYAGEGIDNTAIFNPTVPVYSAADGYNATYNATNTLMNSVVYGPGIGNTEIDKAKSVRCIQE
ncbi:hypothetical protein [Chryseobacterium jejuense]|uniref:Fibrobacter succinogenes major paralogous domain-containing protein n=1 Tax=Chryseobacterium jejuense TaxID=445960 RepID=A0A2X2VAQ3_CHRJE|nr:hypothetical protein [Chryseobacterium jejuense]SDJ11595.1 hypothetical protein SAMN05421542_2697 [Chryseobacterium jejuense]SQB27932.1 Uncharacterised protein [Chryseobacterium jejuense]